MNILILAVGKPKTAHLEPAIKEYEKRLSRWVKIVWQFVPAASVHKESEHIMRVLTPDSWVILLDERGESLPTTQMAEKVESLQNSSVKSITFVIGGAHGVTPTVRERANQLWKLSDLIFPHELVRLVLIEQLYRVYDLNHNGNYHHA
ncbi:MAG TPA: 23S rRNA (pseudouridine(1915)-N(3))-methyltransferase RlmH [Candidatus Limnocylindrales bacterium]|nr:23S rRNA (pseudouridine(1915)-N(3))-methyltransferase RlmH [Candidatus Limnocylindrales bacterium]